MDKGAEPSKPFAAYIDYLESEGYTTPGMKVWVDRIRVHANEATHEIPATERTRAEDTLLFTAELLRLVYEMPFLASRYTPAGEP